MAAEYVGDLAVRIVPDGSGFPAALSTILSGVQKQVQQTYTLNTTGAQQSAQQLGHSINNNVNSAMATAVVQAGAFTAGLYAARGMVSKIEKGLAGLYDPLVKATAGFNAILGEKKGSKLLEDVRQFAKDSPFVTGQLVSYSQQLLGVGQAADTIMPLLENVGDLVASLGGDQQNISRVLFTLTQIRSVGRLMGQDAMQLQAAQIPITKILAKSMDIPLQSVKKLQEQGKISADAVFKALNEAGGRVRGSMDAVTNTISGARSVLQDSITILLQNQSGLRFIYDDLVKAIKAVANALSSKDVVDTLTKLFDNVKRVYLELRPILTEFTKTASNLSMIGLKSFSDILGILANVLNAIPQQALKMLAQALAAIAMVKAPLYLMEYVKQLKTIGSLVTSGAMTKGISNMANGITGVGTASQQAATKVGMLSNVLSRAKGAWNARQDAYYAMFPESAMPESVYNRQNPVYGPPVPGAAPGIVRRNFGKFAGGAAIAGSVAAQYIPQGTAAGAAASGGLSMGSAGAMMALGMGAGPVGVAAGAVGGLLVGGITSYINKNKEMEAAMIAKWKQIGVESANAWVDSQSGVLNQGGQAAVDTYQRQIDTLQQKLKTGGPSMLSQAEVDKLTLEQQTLQSRQATEPLPDTDAQRLKTVNELLDAAANQSKNLTTELQSQIDEVQSKRSKLLEGYSISVQEILKNSPQLESFFKQFNDTTAGLEGAVGPKQDLADKFGVDPDKVGMMESALRSMGITLADLETGGAEILSRIIADFNDMPAAAQRAQTAVTDFNNAWNEAKTAKPLEGFQSEAAAMQSAISAAKALRAGLTEVTKESLPGVIGAMDAAATVEYNLAYERAYVAQKDKPISDADKKMNAAAQATRSMNVLMAQSFRSMREQVGGSTKDFEDLLKQLGLYNQYTVAMSSITGQNTTTLDNYRSSIDKLYTSYGKIPLIEEGARASLLKIAQRYKVTIADLAYVIQLQGEINPSMMITVDANINAAAEKLARLAVIAGGRDKVGAFVKEYTDPPPGSAGMPGITEAGGLVDFYRSRYLAPKGGGGGGGGGGNPMTTVLDSLKSAFKQAADSIKGAAKEWQQSVKASIQYEQAVSVGTATKNAKRQAEDLQAMNTGIEALKKRGLSEEAISSLGISGVKDLKQVKKLLGASDAELLALSTAIAERDKAATDIADKRKAEENKKMMTEAIVAAAKILKVKVTDDQVAGIINNNIEVTVDASDEALAGLARRIADLIKGGTVSR
jgi:tape measure domain-containing protein